MTMMTKVVVAIGRLTYGTATARVTGRSFGKITPFATGGGGVSLATSRRSSVDVEYRYDRIFTDTGINTSRIVASMRVGF